MGGGIMPCGGKSRKTVGNGGLMPCNTEPSKTLDDMEDLKQMLQELNIGFLNRIKEPLTYDTYIQRISESEKYISDNTIKETTSFPKDLKGITRLDTLTQNLFKEGKYTLLENSGFSIYRIADIPDMKKVDMAILRLPDTDKDNGPYEKERYSLDIILKQSSLFSSPQTALRIPLFRNSPNIPQEEHGRYGHIILIQYDDKAEDYIYQDSYTRLQPLENGIKTHIKRLGGP